MVLVIQRLSSLRSRSPVGVAQLWIVRCLRVMKKISIILLPMLLAGCADMMTVGSRSVDPVSYTSERPTFEIQSPTNFVASFFAKD
jgi:hypothetical protein